MADEINTPNHRYYQLKNHIKLARSDMSKSLILASGIRKIDDFMILPLFAAAEPGTWYDPSDLTTLFTDSAGTTPVTGPNQTVGKMLDKSGRGNHATQATSTQRPIYGINPITGTRNLLTRTEEFDNAAWTKIRSSISANIATAPDGTLTADKLVEDSSNNSHFMSQVLLSVSGNASLAISIYAKAAGRDFLAFVTADSAGGFNSSFFNLSNGTLGTVASGHTASIQSAGSGWYRCIIVQSQSATTGAFTFYPGSAATNGSAAYLGDGTSGIYIWGAQLELGSTATAYQKVVSQYEVTEAGVQSASYLFFDGVDDGMVTPTITPATDKAQVFAGVRKLSDAATAILAEFSADLNSSSGAFYITAPTNASGDFAFLSRGSILPANGAGSGSLLAPTTRLITGISDISADSMALRINGSQVATASGDQGTGNYLAYPLYIGRRGGSSFPFNGRIYSLIVRFGPNLTTGQITATESWVNSKTGAF
jgi:hypothetical protein